MKLPKELTTVTPLSKYLALFLLIALPFIGFYLGFKYQEVFDLSNPTPTPTPLAIPTVDPSVTANWKIYKNERMGISFNYPSEWYLFADIADSVQIISTDPEEGGNWAGFNMQTIPHRTLFTDETFISILENNFLGHREKNELIPIEVDGMTAYKLEPDAIPENLSMTEIFLYEGSNIYKIKLIKDVGFPERNEKQINSQIPPTFRFTNENNVEAACLADAKMCPDGKTWVVRQGPNCEFAPCPE